MNIDKSHVATRDPEESKSASKSISEALNGPVDPELIRTVWPFVRCNVKLPGEGFIKNESRELAEDLKQLLIKEIQANDANIQAIKTKYPDVAPGDAGQGEF